MPTRTLRSIFLLGLPCVSLLAGCNEPAKPAAAPPPTTTSKDGTVQIVAAGEKKTKTFNVAPFSEVECDGAFDLDVTLGGQSMVTAEAQDSVLPLVDVQVSGDRLLITTTKPYSSGTPIKVHVVNTSLSGLSLTGAVRASAESKDAEFEGRFAGAAHVRLRSTAKDFHVSALGASEVTLLGETGGSKATLFAGGASTIHADGLALETAEVQAKGASKIWLPELKSLSAVATGASEVRYKGNPKLAKNETSGASTIAGGD